MKITAEFNSNEELISFINTFGANALKGFEPKQEVQAPTVVKKEEIKQEKQPKEEVRKQEVKHIEPLKKDVKKEDEKQDTPAEQHTEQKITKEMIRAAFAKLIKAGKASEAKAITTKFGAKKVPDIKEEDYVAVLKKVEELL